jgi:hypothetical protein
MLVGLLSGSDQVLGQYAIAPVSSAAGAASDPYQRVQPAGGLWNESLLPGNWFGGPAVVATTPVPNAIGTELNGPMLAASATSTGSLFSGGILPGQPLFPGLRNQIDSRLYLRAEYLLWDVDGMDTPPLVTTSPGGTPRATAGVLGESGISVLFADGQLNDGTASGVLLGGGFWITPQRSIAIEAEYYQLEEQDDGYNGSSGGEVILARPFFDIVAGQETAQLISYPDLVSGSIGVASESDFRSALIDLRVALCPTHGIHCQQCGMHDRTDWIIGYRNLRLDDSLLVNENLTSELTSAPGTIAVTDRFVSENEFHGLQLGFVHRANLHKAWLESTLRLALGNNQSTLQIDGQTTYTETGVTDTLPGGLYAQRTNIGTFQEDEFVMIPELGVRLGIRLTKRLHMTVGYSAIYLPNVIRAGEQIDTDLNPGLIPEEANPLTGALRPRLLMIRSDYLAHGLHLGGELHF